MWASSEHGAEKAEPSPYERLLQSLREVFENEDAPLEVVVDPQSALWAVIGGTIMAEKRPYHGLGVVVCSRAVSPPIADSPQLLYKIVIYYPNSPQQRMAVGCFEDGGALLDTATGKRLYPLGEASYTDMRQAIAGTGQNDGAVFQARYTQLAVEEIATKG